MLLAGETQGKHFNAVFFTSNEGNVACAHLQVVVHLGHGLKSLSLKTGSSEPVLLNVLE